jgi:hypothetical protein
MMLSLLFVTTEKIDGVQAEHGFWDKPLHDRIRTDPFMMEQVKDFIYTCLCSDENYDLFDKADAKEFLKIYCPIAYKNLERYLYITRAELALVQGNFFVYNLICGLHYEELVDDTAPGDYRTCDYCEKMVHVNDYHEVSEDCYLCPTCYEDSTIRLKCS